MGDLPEKEIFRGFFIFPNQEFLPLESWWIYLTSPSKKGNSPPKRENRIHEFLQHLPERKCFSFFNRWIFFFFFLFTIGNSGLYLFTFVLFSYFCPFFTFFLRLYLLRSALAPFSSLGGSPLTSVSPSLRLRMAEPTKTEIQEFFKRTRGKLENKVMNPPPPPDPAAPPPCSTISMARPTLFVFVGLF